MTDTKSKKRHSLIVLFLIASAAFGILTLSPTLTYIPASAIGGVTALTQGVHAFMGNIGLLNNSETGWDFNTGTNSISAVLLSVPWSIITGTPNIVNAITQGAHTFTGSIGLTNSTNIGWDFNAGTNTIKGILSGVVTSVGASPPLFSSGGTTPTISCSTCLEGLLSIWPLSSSGGTTPTISCSTCLAGSTIRLSSPTATVAGTTSTGLALSVVANTNYIFQGTAFFNTPTTGASTSDFQIHALAAGASLSQVGMFCKHTGTTVLVDDIAGETASVTTNILPTVLVNSLDYYCTFSGVITVGANPTTIQLDVVATGVSGSILAGSSMSDTTVQ